MSLTDTRLITLGLVIICWFGESFAQHASFSATEYVECGGQSPAMSAKLVSSPLLVSPDGKSAAYSEVAAIAHAQYFGLSAPCSNIVWLFLTNNWGERSSNNKASFESIIDTAVQHPPVLQPFVSGIRLVDWSRDSRYLLGEYVWWAYGADQKIGRQLMLYDRETGKISTADLYLLVRQSAGKWCETDFEILGFTKNGNVEFESKPYESKYYAPVQCFDTVKLWRYDINAEIITPVQTREANHFGRILEPEKR